MKLIAKILLILFVAFLSTPAIIAVLKKGCDTSLVVNMSEEEQLHKEVKVFVDHIIIPEFSLLTFELNRSTKVHFGNLAKHNNVSATIFSPPPEV